MFGEAFTLNCIIPKEPIAGIISQIDLFCLHATIEVSWAGEADRGRVIISAQAKNLANYPVDIRNRSNGQVASLERKMSEANYKGKFKFFWRTTALPLNRDQAVASLSSAFATLLSDFDSERAENKRFRMVFSRVSEVTFRPNKSLT